MIQHQRERLTRELFREAMPLLSAHYHEIAHFQDIPLDPDEDQYIALELAGLVRVFTARDVIAHDPDPNCPCGRPDGEHVDRMVGYAVFFVKPNLHYRSSIQALQDVLYVAPEYRGRGGRFIVWCDEQLKAEGVQVVYHHVKAAHNFGALLERLAYKLVDLIYARRLS